MKYALVLFTMLVSLLADANEKPLYTIYTGSPKGTYIAVAEDMAKACTQFDINVEPSQGSLENINALILEPVVKNGYRMAMVQQDALESIIASDPRVKNIYKLGWPLYTEEVNIIINKESGIHSIKDLAGKKVAGGLPGSGIWFTSNVIRNALGIKWLNIDKTPEEAILQVLTGEVDAMVVVGGAPLRLFQELSKPMNARIAMLPVTAPELDKYYTPAKVPANTYLWQDYPVETRATKSLMIAAADVPDSAIKEFQKCLTTNLPAIRKFGHPKWKEVSLQQQVQLSQPKLVQTQKPKVK